MVEMKTATIGLLELAQNPTPEPIKINVSISQLALLVGGKETIVQKKSEHNGHIELTDPLKEVRRPKAIQWRIKGNGRPLGYVKGKHGYISL